MERLARSDRHARLGQTFPPRGDQARHDGTGSRLSIGEITLLDQLVVEPVLF